MFNILKDQLKILGKLLNVLYSDFFYIEIFLKNKIRKKCDKHGSSTHKKNKLGAEERK